MFPLVDISLQQLTSSFSLIRLEKINETQPLFLTLLKLLWPPAHDLRRNISDLEGVGLEYILCFLTDHSKVPTPLILSLGPTISVRQNTAALALEPLSSPACNAHLAIVVLDTLILALFPELAAKTVLTQ